MTSSDLAKAASLLTVLSGRVFEDAGDNFLRESIKDHLLGFIGYLTTDELNELLKDFQKILISIEALPVGKQTLISLLISKSEILTFVGIIYDKLEQYDLALEYRKEARAIQKIVNAFIGAKTDWHFLRTQLNSKTVPDKDNIKRLKTNLPVLMSYYKEIGNEEAMIGVRNELEKVNSLTVWAK